MEALFSGTTMELAQNQNLENPIYLMKRYIKMKTGDECPSFEELQKIVAKFDSKEIENSFEIRGITYNVEKGISRGA